MIQGISHITFIVQDIAKTSQLFQYVLGGVEVYSSESKMFSLAKEKFLLVGGLWVALMEGPLLPKSYNHIAFKVDTKDLPLYLSKLKEMSVETLEGRSRMSEEGESVYFYDYDNHLFELHTGTLEARLKFYAQSEPRQKEKDRNSSMEDLP